MKLSREKAMLIPGSCRRENNWALLGVLPRDSVEPKNELLEAAFGVPDPVGWLPVPAFSIYLLLVDILGPVATLQCSYRPTQ